MSQPIFARLATVVAIAVACTTGTAAQTPTSGTVPGPAETAASQTPAAPQTEPQAPPALPPPPVDPAEGGPSADAVRIGPVTFSGATWVESLFVGGDHTGQPMDTFRIRRARLTLAGNATPKIGWSLAGEFSGAPSLRVAFVQFRISPQLAIRAGQATPPSSLERSTNPLILEFIDRSLLAVNLTHSLDVGVTIMSETPIKQWLGYALSVVNGAGFNRSDDNRGKDIVARLRITPPAIAGLVFNLGGATGEQPQGTRQRAMAGVQYEIPTLKVGVEGVRQQIDQAEASRGVVVFCAWRYRPENPTPHFRMLEFAGRYFYVTDPSAGPPPIDEDGGTPPPGSLIPETVREIAAGVNYDVTRNVRVMSDVIVPVDDRPSSVTSLTRLQLLF